MGSMRLGIAVRRGTVAVRKLAKRKGWIAFGAGTGMRDCWC